MKNINALFCLFLFALILAGCKEEKEPGPPTKEQLITAKNWKLTEAKFTTNFGEADAYPLLPACQQDNFLKFAAGGKVTADEGANKCVTTAPQTQQGNWSINGETLTIDGAILTALGLPSTAPRNFTILELTNQSLKLTLNESITFNLPGIPLPVTASTGTLTFTGQ